MKFFSKKDQKFFFLIVIAKVKTWKYVGNTAIQCYN